MGRGFRNIYPDQTVPACLQNLVSGSSDLSGLSRFGSRRQSSICQSRCNPQSDDEQKNEQKASVRHSQAEDQTERGTKPEKYLAPKIGVPGRRRKRSYPLLFRFHNRRPQITDKPHPYPGEGCNKSDSGPLCSGAQGKPLC